MRALTVILSVVVTAAVLTGRGEVALPRVAVNPLVVSIGGPGAPDGPEATRAAREIQALIFGMTEAWNRHDLAGFMEGIWKDPRTLLVLEAQQFRGWAEAYAAYQRGYADPTSMGQLVCERLETQLLTPEIALCETHWTLHLKGGTTVGQSTLVVRKFAEGWKLVSDHTSVAEP